MNIRITMPQELKDQTSHELGLLATLIEEEGDIVVERQKEPAPPGIKEPVILTAIAIAGLSLTAVGTIISVLQYWQSQQPKYTVTVKRGDLTIQLADIKLEEIDDALAQIQARASDSAIDVMITGVEG